MFTFSNLLLLAHLIGLALGVGSATVKLVLLLKCNVNSGFISIYVKVVKPITFLIILGLILITFSGIGWLLKGYSFTPLLIVKVILVGFIWVLGPLIDNVVEPRFEKLAPLSGEAASPEFYP